MLMEAKCHCVYILVFVLFPNFPLLATAGDGILSWGTAKQSYNYEIMKFSTSLLVTDHLIILN